MDPTRNALPSGVDLLVDGGGSSPDFPGARGGKDWQRALRTAEMLAKYDVKFYEEPLHPTDYEGVCLGMQYFAACTLCLCSYTLLIHCSYTLLIQTATGFKQLTKASPVKIAGLEVVQVRRCSKYID